MTDKRKDCQMRHENGNCTVAGGFCTAVNNPICEALHNAFDCGYRSALRQQDHFREVTKKVEPLTMDELRKMDNQPVWIEDVGEYKWHGSGWAIVDREHCLVRIASNGNPAFFERYWKEWVAYCQKPEEDDHE